MLLWWGGTASFSRRCDLDLFTLGFSWVHKLYTATGKLVNIGDLLFRDPKLRIDFIYNSCCFMFQITERSPYPARALSSILYSAGWSWESENDQRYIWSIAGQTTKTWTKLCKGILKPQKCTCFSCYLPSWKLTYPSQNARLKMIFLFPGWDMLVPWRVIVLFWWFWSSIQKYDAIYSGHLYLQVMVLEVFFETAYG